jgi:alpha-L-fucosidase
MRLSATACAALLMSTSAESASSPTPTGNRIDPGPFQPTWESLVSQYQCPEWFRDAKFGLWAHWTAQCVPETGDWYARQMYIQGTPENRVHVARYGHPSKFGFIELDHRWKAEKWEPEKLMDLYARAGAKYFVALANHHDNFDCYDSKYHAWNSVNVGPKRDIVGTWARVARARGLRFGVTNHSSHAWHWFQPAYGYDAEGPYAGVRYDAATLTVADGKGKWWEGLDPRQLYTAPTLVMPDGIRSIEELQDWHTQHTRPWVEDPPVDNPEFTRTWYLRCRDLVDKYQPDLLYFDNTGLPLGQTGLDIAAHFYNANVSWHGGKLEAVLNAKILPSEHRPAMVEDYERGKTEGIMPQPWQTDTCIGNWHYDRSVYEQRRYKSAQAVIHMLIDIVSKNGNLLLSVPVRGDGTIDEDEVKALEGIAAWMAVNSEAIFATRPWKVYGEGPSTTEKPETGEFSGVSDVRAKPYTGEDIRFTQSKDGKSLYAIALAVPTNGTLTVKSLASGSAHWPDAVGRVRLLGVDADLKATRDASGLHVTLPDRIPSEHALALGIQK